MTLLRPLLRRRASARAPRAGARARPHAVAVRIAALGPAPGGEPRRGPGARVSWRAASDGRACASASSASRCPGAAALSQRDRRARHPAQLPADRHGAHRHPPAAPGRERQRLRASAWWRRWRRGWRGAPACDVWLVATGAEERVYTGSPDHLGALALARRVRARGRPRAPALGAVARRGGPRPPVLAALPRARPPRRGWRASCSPPRGRPACRSPGCATGQRQLRPPRVRAAGPAGGQARRRRGRRALPPQGLRPAGRLDRRSLAQAQRLVERALTAP